MSERTPCDTMAAVDGASGHLAPLCLDCRIDVLAALLGAALLGYPPEHRALAHMRFEAMMIEGMRAPLPADPIGAPAGHA